MTTLTINRLETPSLPLWNLLKKELAPYPGRADSVLRFMLCCAIVIVCSMTLQVPFLALSLLMVFFTSQENTVLTRLSGILLIIGATLSVLLALIVLKLTVDYTMLRILFAGAVAFCGMYFMRISKLGTVGFIVALVVFYSQSFVDLYDSPEQITRALLWVWVAVLYPIALTITVNLLLRPAHPERLMVNEISRQLGDVRRQLAARKLQSAIPVLTLDAVGRGVQVLHRHLMFATRSVSSIERDKACYLMRIAAIDRLHTAAARLSQFPATPITAAQYDLIGRLEQACLSVEKTVSDCQTATLDSSLVSEAMTTGELDRVLREMAHAVRAFANSDTTPTASTSAAREGRLAADAFRNPVYAQFAAKTVLAAMLCYVFYNGVQWPGIHTAMLTCFILALPSLGTSAHKGLTRIIGCALGSAVSLAVAVFIIPHLENITGLLMVALPIIAAGAWIAAGSARISYVGAQFVFAYALAQLGQFGPVTDLTEIRDRMIGILVGVGVSLALSTWLWPEREGTELLNTLARLLRSIAGLTRAGPSMVDNVRAQSWMLLNQNRELQGRVALEPGWQYAHGSVTSDMTTWLAQAQETLFAVNWLQVAVRHDGVHAHEQVVDALAAFQEQAAAALERMAATLEAQTATEDSEDTLPTTLERLDRLSDELSATSQSGDRARELAAAARGVYERIVQLQRGLPATQSNGSD